MTQPLNIQQMVTKVGLRIGVRVTQAPVGSSDLQLQQLVELFNEEVYELGTLYRWAEHTEEATFVTTAAEDQGVFFGAGGILPPATLFNYIISDTMWDRTARQPIPGPKSTLDWQARKALQYTSGPFPTYRIRANRLLLLPVPAAGHNIYFEFAKKNFVYTASGDTYGATFMSNEAVPVLDCDIIMAGVRWRWKRAKGFAYSDEKKAWDSLATTACGRGTGNETLNLGGGNTISSGARGGDWSTRQI